METVISYAAPVPNFKSLAPGVVALGHRVQAAPRRTYTMPDGLVAVADGARSRLKAWRVAPVTGGPGGCGPVAMHVRTAFPPAHLDWTTVVDEHTAHVTTVLLTHRVHVEVVDWDVATELRFVWVMDGDAGRHMTAIIAFMDALGLAPDPALARVSAWAHKRTCSQHCSA